MPLFAAGSKSSLHWKEETTFGVPATGNYNQLPLNSETLDETINTIIGEDIRSDRATGAVRGGNIASGGKVTHDFGLVRELPWLRHLLAAGTAAAGSAITIATIAASTAYKRGDIVKNTGGDIFLCTIGGTTDSGITGTSLSVTGGRQSIAGASSTTLEFEYAAVAATPYFLHTLTGGIDWPTGGLTIEKAVKGVATPLYLKHAGCRLNSLDLTLSQEAITKASWAILSLGATPSNSAGVGTPTLVPEDPVTGYSIALMLNDAANASPRPFREASMNITNQSDESVYVMGSRIRQDIPPGTRRISGNLSMYFVDRTEYDFFKNETTVSMRFSMVFNGEFLEIELPEVKLTGNGSPKISGQGIISAQMDWTAFKRSANYDIKITARNRTQNLPV